MKRLFALAALILILPAVASGYRSPTKLNDVVTWLAGRPVTIHCLTKQESDWDKYIVLGAAAYVEYTTDAIGREYPKDVTVFSYPLCIPLVDALRGRAYYHTLDDMAWSILAITHESGHLRGGNFPQWKSEREVNCWALRRVKAVAQVAFGFDENMAEQLEKQAVSIYKEQPPAYRKNGCAKGL